jgi:Mg/Co/Ni transporter MgtE
MGGLTGQGHALVIIGAVLGVVCGLCAASASGRVTYDDDGERHEHPDWKMGAIVGLAAFAALMVPIVWTV